MVEVEYVEACATCREAVWFRKLMFGLFGLKLEATCIWCDNQSCMKLSENLVFHDRTKHIEIIYQGYGAKGGSEAPVHDNQGAGCRRVDQATVEDEVQAL
jgi:hypothetical protein